MQKHALKSGFMISVISIVITLLIYMVDSTMMVKWWFGLISIVIAIGLVSYFGITYRNEVGGYLSFKIGYVYSFITFIVSGLIGTVFMLLMYNVIDPDLPDTLAEASKEQAIEMMSGFGAPADTIDEQIAIAEKNGDFTNPFTIMGQIKGFGIALIIYAVLALITGAIIKKNEPELT